MPSLVHLAEELLAQAKKMDALLKQNGSPDPSFSHDTLESLPEDAQQLRKDIFDTSHVIGQLARGARRSGLDLAYSWTDQLVLRIVWQFDLASAIPLDGSATYDQISAASGLSRSLVVRTIRAAIPLNIFDELSTHEVCHTALSKLLAEDKGFSSVIGLEVEDLGPASTKLIEVWKNAEGDVGDPNKSAFSLFNGGRSLFAAMSEDPKMAHRFNLAMEYSAKDNNYKQFDIVNAFGWGSLDHLGSRLFDLGGGYGQNSQVLARHTKHLEFIVQDLPHVVEEGRHKLPLDLKSRVFFEAWDFLQVQSIASPPNAFLISRCLHNWSDHYCTIILRALIPALRRGSKVLIWDVVLEDRVVKKMSERFALQQDFIMATVSNGKDRTLAEFQQILDMSDKRFRIDSLRRLQGCNLSMIEVTWDTA